MKKKLLITLGSLCFMNSIYAAAVNNHSVQFDPIVAGTNQSSVFTSMDNGATWQPYQIDDYGNTAFNVLYINHQFVVNNATVYLSPDGINWTPTQNSYFGSPSNVTYINNEYFGLGDVGCLGESSNATNWQCVSIPNPPGFNTQFLGGIAYGNGMYVMSGGYENQSQSKTKLSQTKSKFKSSDDPTWEFTAISRDAINWTLTQTNNFYSDILWDGKQFVAVSTNGIIATSVDGVTWSTQYNNPSAWISKIIYANNTYVALAQSQNSPYPSILLTSKDAKSWSEQSLPGGNMTFGEVKYINQEFWIAGTDVGGAGGEILESPDAINWQVVFSQAELGIYSIG